MASPARPLSELLRPQRLGELTLPQRHREALTRMISEGRMMNLLFHGRPGSGKTTAARLIISELGSDSIEVNGASLVSVEAVRARIEGFVSTVSFSGGTKICFIDEADSMSKAADAALRILIEKAAAHCRFLVVANSIVKLSPGIKSRLTEICFDISPSQRAAVCTQWLPVYEAKLSAFGIQYDKTRLRGIVAIYFPDLRAINNRVEFEFGGAPSSSLASQAI